MISKTTAVKVEQTMAVPVFFASELLELFRLFRVVFLQAVGEIVVNAGVFFLERHGQREDLLFGERVKGSHRLSGSSPSLGGANSLPPIVRAWQSPSDAGSPGVP